MTLLSNVLYIDLTKKRYHIKQRPELFREYIGGAGVAAQLLMEECPPGIPADSPENPVVLAIGPLTALFPLACKTVAMFKSPLTGNLGESHAGGRSAVSMRLAGYGAIVIKGASESPVYISINEHKVYFRDATTLWGMKNCFTVGSIIRQRETGSGFRSIMRIGRGGENGVSFGAVTTETFRHFGRLGMGAVWGSKKLKAIVLAGNHSIPIEDKKGYKKHYDFIYSQATETSLMKKYHDLGTAGNVNSLNALKALPTRNLKTAVFEGAEKISGEAMAENYLGRRVACSHCPVGCVHLGTLRSPYKDKPYFYKTTMIGYDFELIYALGSMLGIDNPEHLLELIDTVEKVCIDAMSTGVVLAWATEMLEKGLISEKETDGLKLQWGDAQTYVEAVNKLVFQPTDFYKALARGCAYASSVYGGKEFAMTFGGNEMAGYHTGPAGYLGFLLGCRHSHLDNGGYGIDQKDLIDNTLTPAEIVDKILKEEEWRQILSSLVICFFARGIYSPGVVKDGLGIAGLEKSEDDILEIGKKIHRAKYEFKFREGFSFDKLHIPERIFETPSPTMAYDRKFMDEAIAYAEKKLKE
ncbi:MAG: aldehyde ferredoxin oxidoreductase family protein [bacterium]|nr:aldehyde ferredoxin oxidoreductase family protein [bacterium]